MFRIQRAVALIDGIGAQTQKITLRCQRGLKNSPTVRQQAAEGEPQIRGTPYTKLSVGIPKEIFPK